MTLVLKVKIIFTWLGRPINRFSLLLSPKNGRSKAQTFSWKDLKVLWLLNMWGIVFKSRHRSVAPFFWNDELLRNNEQTNLRKNSTWVHTKQIRSKHTYMSWQTLCNCLRGSAIERYAVFGLRLKIPYVDWCVDELMSEFFVLWLLLLCMNLCMVVSSMFEYVSNMFFVLSSPEKSWQTL